MQPLIYLLKKDLTIELRAKELLLSLFVLSLILVTVFSLGLQGAFINQQTMLRIFPLSIWITFIFAATVSISRSFEYEVEYGALDGLLQLGINPIVIFLSKFISNTIIITLNVLFLEIALCLFLDISPHVIFPSILIPTFFVSSGYSSLATLFSALTQYGRVRSLLLPLILLPLLFPLYLAALESTHEILLSRFGWDSPWSTLLLTLNVVYILSSTFLFEYVVKE